MTRTANMARRFGFRAFPLAVLIVSCLAFLPGMDGENPLPAPVAEIGLGSLLPADPPIAFFRLCFADPRAKGMFAEIARNPTLQALPQLSQLHEVLKLGSANAEWLFSGDVEDLIFMLPEEGEGTSLAQLYRSFFMAIRASGGKAPSIMESLERTGVYLELDVRRGWRILKLVGSPRPPYYTESYIINKGDLIVICSSTARMKALVDADPDPQRERGTPEFFQSTIDYGRTYAILGQSSPSLRRIESSVFFEGGALIALYDFTCGDFEQARALHALFEESLSDNPGTKGDPTGSPSRLSEELAGTGFTKGALAMLAVYAPALSLEGMAVKLRVSIPMESP